MSKLNSPIHNDNWKKHTKNLSVYFFNSNKQIQLFFKAEKHCPCTGLFWAGRKEPQSGGGRRAGTGSFPAGLGAGYAPVFLDQPFC